MCTSQFDEQLYPLFQCYGCLLFTEGPSMNVCTFINLFSENLDSFYWIGIRESCSREEEGIKCSTQQKIEDSKSRHCLCFTSGQDKVVQECRRGKHNVLFIYFFLDQRTWWNKQHQQWSVKNGYEFLGQSLSGEGILSQRRGTHKMQRFESTTCVQKSEPSG